MKYMAIIDAEEKPVSCKFLGCDGNVIPYLIGTTTDIKALKQESVLDKIKAEITDKSYLSYDNNPRHIIDESWVLEIIDKYKTESEG